MNSESPKASEVFSVRLPGEVLLGIRAQAKTQGRQISDVMREAIEAGLRPLPLWVNVVPPSAGTTITAVPLMTVGENLCHMAEQWAPDPEVQGATITAGTIWLGEQPAA